MGAVGRCPAALRALIPGWGGHLKQKSPPALTEGLFNSLDLSG